MIRQRQLCPALSFRAVVLLTLLSLVWFALQSAASVGDRDPRYRKCLHECIRKVCAGAENMLSSDSVRAAGKWTCGDDCRYDCMHANRAERERKGEPTVQYHGKWPFIRFAFVQEPASTIFSFLNVLPHVYFLTFLMRNRFIFTQSKKELPFELWTLLIHASLGALAFSFSVLFHTRDLQWTEALDYTGGFLYASSLFLVIMSFFLKGRDVEGIRSNIFHSILYFAWVAFCAHHLYSLFFVKFDYGYNIQVIAVITILSMSLALVFTWKEWSRPHSWRIALSLLALPPLSLLELFDFPPFLLIFDAHSVWHACTPLVFSLFYTYFTNVVSDLRQAKSK